MFTVEPQADVAHQWQQVEWQSEQAARSVKLVAQRSKEVKPLGFNLLFHCQIAG